MHFNRARELELKALLRSHADIFRLLIETAELRLGEQNYAQAAQWSGAAASFVSQEKGFSGALASPDLESLLGRVAAALNVPVAQSKFNESGQLRTLHIVSQAYHMGGHTRMAYLWMKFDHELAKHSVVFVNQTEALPPAFAEAISKVARGGVHFMSASDEPLRKAAALRQQIAESADLVVLHIHPDDIVPVIALGSSGLPPVIFINHADHVFWVGGSVADVVADIRASGHRLTKAHRSVARATILPLPLEFPRLGQESSMLQRRSAREKLGIAEDAIVLLTAGAAYKYSPIGDYGFLPTAETILRSTSNTVLLAAGPSPQARWKSLSEELDGRLIAAGIISQTAMYEVGVDVYLEGFPFGSLTAVLEAAGRGIPCVLAPESTPLPYSSDDLALHGLTRPKDVTDYVEQTISFIVDRPKREEVGAVLAHSVKELHGREGWLLQLNDTKKKLRKAHSVSEANTSPVLPESLSLYWAAFEFRNRSCAFDDQWLEPLASALLKWRLTAADMAAAPFAQRLTDLYQHYNHALPRRDIAASLCLEMADITSRQWSPQNPRHLLSAAWKKEPTYLVNGKFVRALIKTFFGAEVVNRVRRIRLDGIRSVWQRARAATRGF